MRRFYGLWPLEQIRQTASIEFPGLPQGEKGQTASVDSAVLRTAASAYALEYLARRFPLPWSHYVLLLKVKKPEAREFYEAEAHRNGWAVRQLERQITTLFYERLPGTRGARARTRRSASSSAPRRTRPSSTTPWKTFPTRSWPPSTGRRFPTKKTLAAELEAKRRLLESRTKPEKGGQS
jgi:hypothetical protein